MVLYKSVCAITLHNTFYVLAQRGGLAFHLQFDNVQRTIKIKTE